LEIVKRSVELLNLRVLDEEGFTIGEWKPIPNSSCHAGHGQRETT
jgi:hypothetical protein